MPVSIPDLFQSSRDAAAGHAANYGLPTNRTLVIGDRATGSGFTWLQIEPCPAVDVVSPQLVSRYQQIPDIQVELDDLQISGISKAYSIDQIKGRGKFYVVGLTAIQCQSLVYDRFDLKTFESFGAIVCDLIPGVEVEEQHALHWSMVLRRRSIA